MRWRKELKEIREILAMADRIGKMNCGTDEKCIIEKIFLKSELGRRLNKLIHKIALTWNQFEEWRPEIDAMVEALIQMRLITRDMWEGAKRREAAYQRYVLSPESRLAARVMRDSALRELIKGLVDTLELNMVEYKGIHGERSEDNQGGVEQEDRGD